MCLQKYATELLNKEKHLKKFLQRFHFMQQEQNIYENFQTSLSDKTLKTKRITQIASMVYMLSRDRPRKIFKQTKNCVNLQTKLMSTMQKTQGQAKLNYKLQTLKPINACIKKVGKPTESAVNVVVLFQKRSIKNTENNAQIDIIQY
ncbi:hypothetical protein pb186bvf_005060 [Paramecium bursaria]